MNNGLLSMVELIANGSPVYSAPFWMATIEERGEVIGCAVHAKPDGLVFSEMPADAIRLVHSQFSKDLNLPHRIMGPKVGAQQLAALWRDQEGVTAEISTMWHSYCLDKVTQPKRKAAGRLRKGRKDELELVRSWGQEYGKEKPAPVDVANFMEMKLANEALFVWDDNGVKTILTMSGWVCSGARISAVYTPPEHRGRGYASAAVADLSQQTLDQGREYVNLVAQIGDPSERIYKALGYKKIGCRYCYLFDA